jgi:DASH complex subunit DAM1
MEQPRSTSRNRLPLRPRSRSPVSRPTTPLRPSSRSSFRGSQSNGVAPAFALDALEPQFAELSDSMADLEANFMHLQLMHESLSRFGECFASFLYGLNMNAFVVDFPEAPMADSIRRFQKQQRQREAHDASTSMQSGTASKSDADTTFMTTDSSFVGKTSMTATPMRKTVGNQSIPGTTMTSRSSTAPSTRGSSTARGSRGASRVGRGSGLPRGRGGARGFK